jgi:hypothetical protein
LNNPECNSGKIKTIKRTSTLKELNVLRLVISKRVLQMLTYTQILYQIIFSTIIKLLCSLEVMSCLCLRVVPEVIHI